MAKKNKFKQYLKRVLSQLFYYSYILTDNKNLAEKIIFDAYCSFLIRNKRHYDRIESDESRWDEVKISMLRNIYQITKIHTHEEYESEFKHGVRFDQQESADRVGNSRRILLNHEEKSFFFLKDKLFIPPPQIMAIMGYDQQGMLSILQETRKKISQLGPMENEIYSYQ